MEDKIFQNIKLENFEGALNTIIKIMNVTEKEKIKRVEILAGLEKKVARRLQIGQTEEAIEELINLIDEYKRLGLIHKSQILELTLNQLLLESESFQQVAEVEEPPIISIEDEQAIIQVLENRSKKAIRRFIQGKTDDAILEMLNIIKEFRRLGMNERVKALQDWMYQFLGKKLDYEEEKRPLSERLDTDPELEEQLLSYRTHKILKKFLRGENRKAVMEYNEVVNDYKRQGKLDLVETLELWFNLFITKTYLVPSQTQKYQDQQPKPPSILSSTPPSEKKAQSTSSPTDKFKEKIFKIRNLLKKFEESI